MFCGYCGKQNAEDYRFCTGCGKPLESGTPDQPAKIEGESKNLNALPHDNQETKSGEESVPQSKYLSVSWWKDCEWPWQARSLDGRTLLGSYETEVKAAEVVAKHHGVNIADLLTERQTSEIEREENRCLLLKRVLDKNNNLPKKSKPLKVLSEGSLSFDSPLVASRSDKNKLHKQEVNKKTSREKMVQVLKCPRCTHTYTPIPEDFSHPIVNMRDNKQIFLRRYGHNSEGRHIECLICLSCDSINFVQFSLLKGIPSLFGLPISPYKPFINPVLFNNIRTEANRIHDITKKDIPSILNDELLIPPHIFDFLLEIKLFSLGDLGLRYRGNYIEAFRSYAAYISDEYSQEEMHEKHDVHDRLEEIKFNTGQED